MRLFEHVFRVKKVLMKNPRYLTKTRMKLGLECPKKLFYYGKDEFETLNTGNEGTRIVHVRLTGSVFVDQGLIRELT